LAFRLKHDGFRSLAYLENGRCRLVSRRRNTYKSFEVLRSALEGLKAQSAILDGEIVALDSSGVSQFKELLCYRIANVYQPSKVTASEPRSSSYGAGL
jgi:bifunctional non-homologous end joining protein LigD